MLNMLMRYKEDIHWLGYDWQNREFYASDSSSSCTSSRFNSVRKTSLCRRPERRPEFANIAHMTKPGTNSPFGIGWWKRTWTCLTRCDRRVPGWSARVLRAKMIWPRTLQQSGHVPKYLHTKPSPHRRPNSACAYNFAHGQSDWIEGVTHSLCDLAYEDHRPLYDWFLNSLGIFHTRHVAPDLHDFRLLLKAVSGRGLCARVGRSTDADAQRHAPALRPAAISGFIDAVGVAKNENLIDISLLEHMVRDDLKFWGRPRVMGVLNPLKVVISFPENQVERLEAINNQKLICPGSAQCAVQPGHLH